MTKCNFSTGFVFINAFSVCSQIEATSESKSKTLTIPLLFKRNRLNAKMTHILACVFLLAIHP